ncbi:hypothetical protein TH53_01085 [Pedobacter lusitanus]|uniref:Methyltransferase domain-containing protein n=1 Tax=Pedobacter lusitanus TaxID=1503925 RepID=A0A0D0GRT4_9SPHI|nr:methyltransferase domain-containing protein [Pedobacter lusitanus]KIO78925.1 hypothetical protein TH53_01085 [Pedobacter lusitanus]
MNILESVWDPALYSKYEKYRLIPPLELINRLNIYNPEVIYELGCGLGNTTRLIKDKWSNAKVYGLDNSSEMLNVATEIYPELNFIETDINKWQPDDEPDLLIANSLFHLIDNHENILIRLTTLLKKGGQFAIQMPVTFYTPWYQLMIDVLRYGIQEGILNQKEALLEMVEKEIVQSVDYYYSLFDPLSSSIDIWETEYYMELEGDDAVFNWVEGAGLRPVLSNLNPVEYDFFINQYKKRVGELYWKRKNHKTIFPFKRMFLVITR